MNTFLTLVRDGLCLTAAGIAQMVLISAEAPDRIGELQKQLDGLRGGGENEASTAVIEAELSRLRVIRRAKDPDPLKPTRYADEVIFRG